MQAQAYDGYVNNGQFFPKESPIRLPGRFRAVLTVLDVPKEEEAEDTDTSWVDELERMVKECTGEKLRPEDFPRMDFGREPIIFDDKE